MTHHAHRGRTRWGAWLVVLLWVGCSAPKHPTYLPPVGIDVRHYDVALRLDPETRHLEGQVTLEVRRTQAATELPLCFGMLVVDSVRVDGRAVAPVRRGQRLIIPLNGELQTRVTLAYHGTPSEGLYEATYLGQRVVFTDSWPYRGCEWLPAVHHPSDPATLALTLTVPRGYQAAGSGRLVRIDTLDAAVRFRWQLDATAPTYSFAFAVADYVRTDTVADDTIPIHYYLLPSDRDRVYRLRRTPDALHWLSRWLGPYPYRSYAVVQVPIDYAGMENASAPFLRADLFDMGDVEGVQVHELVHQWFGNRVSIAGWRDLWLSEGTATYLTTMFYEAYDGFEVARQQWVDMARLTPEALRLHGALVPGRYVDPEAHLTWVPYRKGACVLHLLRLKLGDATFQRALQTVYRRFAGKPLSTEGFQAVLEEVGGRDLDALFDYWVYGDRLPELRVYWEAAQRRLTWRVVGDGGTLQGVPFQLAVQQGAQVRYVDARASALQLPEATERPEVHPVGILMKVVYP
ncbi:M1 family metallopeptidase [Rhodothermus marinus]|uniref:Aminopeptidase N n=1 Tax=Rhodothermus marinus (strain ATCC 43812 / DSM 4252 / R-10) TaxID=518766 RepID=D0ME67_RHOM4|nr:M1 family metallopeptidase [Rhodothermus marinus]ACY47291.1 Peptidase M1 membrane alanine aminopeptidase [Rhodothermus marinus DSM 4252]